jgi:hypothetical protein
MMIIRLANHSFTNIDNDATPNCIMSINIKRINHARLLSKIILNLYHYLCTISGNVMSSLFGRVS